MPLSMKLFRSFEDILKNNELFSFSKIVIINLLLL